MSQKTKIVGLKHSGASVLINGEYTRDPLKILQHNADIYRARFNDCRAHRLSRRYDFYMDDYGNEMRKFRRACVDDTDSTLFWSKKDIPLGGTYVEAGKFQGDTDFRIQNPWITGACNTVVNIAKYLENKEWGAALKRIKTSGGRTPEFKRAKDSDTVFSVALSATNLYQCGRHTWMLHIKGGGTKKVNKWKLKIRVRSSQPLREYSQVQINATTGYVVFTNSPLPLTGVKHTGAVVGIDRGVAHTLVTSDGEFFDMPSAKPGKTKIKKIQRKLARRKGSKKHEPKSNRYMRELEKQRKIEKKLANTRETFHHQKTAFLVKNYDLIVLEDLHTSKMTKSAKGTAEKPGKNVAAKSGLNRSILEQGWYQFEQFLQYKAKLADVHVGFVPAPNTSRKCSSCGHIAKENRESQAIFFCKNCGHTENADINAAKNILGNYLKSPGGAELALGRGARAAGCEASTMGELAPPPYAHRE